jgi:hypothetical protein
MRKALTAKYQPRPSTSQSPGEGSMTAVERLMSPKSDVATIDASANSIGRPNNHNAEQEAQDVKPLDLSFFTPQPTDWMVNLANPILPLPTPVPCIVEGSESLSNSDPSSPPSASRQQSSGAVSSGAYLTLVSSSWIHQGAAHSSPTLADKSAVFPSEGNNETTTTAHTEGKNALSENTQIKPKNAAKSAITPQPAKSNSLQAAPQAGGMAADIDPSLERRQPDLAGDILNGVPTNPRVAMPTHDRRIPKGGESKTPSEAIKTEVSWSKTILTENPKLSSENSTKSGHTPPAPLKVESSNAPAQANAATAAIEPPLEREQPGLPSSSVHIDPAAAKAATPNHVQTGPDTDDLKVKTEVGSSKTILTENPALSPDNATKFAHTPPKPSIADSSNAPAQANAATAAIEPPLEREQQGLPASTVHIDPAAAKAATPNHVQTRPDTDDLKVKTEVGSSKTILTENPELSSENATKFSHTPPAPLKVDSSNAPGQANAATAAIEPPLEQDPAELTADSANNETTEVRAAMLQQNRKDPGDGTPKERRQQDVVGMPDAKSVLSMHKTPQLKQSLPEQGQQAPQSQVLNRPVFNENRDKALEASNLVVNADILARHPGNPSGATFETNPATIASPAERMGSVEKMHDLILDKVVEMKRVSASTYDVTVKMDNHADLKLHIRQDGQNILVSAQCEPADERFFGAQWAQLEKAMSTKGIDLIPLNQTARAASADGNASGFDRSGPDNRQNTRERQAPLMEDDATASFAKASGNNISTAKRGGGVRRASGIWEDWA